MRESHAGELKATVVCRKFAPVLIILLLRSVQPATGTGFGLEWIVDPAAPGAPVATAIDAQGHIRLVSCGGPCDLFFKTYDTQGHLLESATCTNQGITGVNGVVDAAGNTWATGVFVKQAKIGNLFLNDPGIAASCGAMFVARYSPAGAALWASGSVGGYGVIGWAVTTDQAGNAFVTGEYVGTPANPAKIGTTSLTNSQTSIPDAFVAKYDTAGRAVWAKQFGEGGVLRTWAIVADKASNVYVAGIYSDPGVARWDGTNLVIIEPPGHDQMVCKYSSTGSVLWSRRSKGFFASAMRMAIDGQGNICIVGAVQGTNSFGSTVVSTPPGANSDALLASYDSAGNLLWARQAGGTNIDVLTAVTMDTEGNSYGYGTYSQTTTIGNTILTNATSPYYIGKWNTQGDCVWAVSVPPINTMAAGAPDTLYLADGGNSSALRKMSMIAAPMIVAQPTNQTINPGGSALLSVTAAPGSVLKYQWYRGQSGDVSQPILGAETNVYRTPTLTQTAWFWVRISNAGGTIDSATATVTVPAPPQITVQPGSRLILRGESVTLSVTATGTEPLSYQWYVGSDASRPIPGAISNSYTTGPVSSNSLFWVMVSNAAGWMASATAGITVVDPVRITQQPQSVNITNGQKVTLTVVATGGQALWYQWFIGSSGDTNNPIPGETLSHYTTPALFATARYWVLVSSVGSRVESQTAELTLSKSSAGLQTPQWSQGKLSFQLNATPGSKWTVQSSADLRNWHPASGLGAINVGVSGCTNLQAMPEQSQTFYRAILVP